MVGASNQYILKSLFSSRNLNDEKAVIPLLKEIEEGLPLSYLSYHTQDAGYDFEAIYEQVHRMGHRYIIASNKRNELESVCFDEHFALTRFRGHSYR